MKLSGFILILYVNILIFLGECPEGTVATQEASDAPRNGKRTEKVTYG